MQKIKKIYHFYFSDILPEDSNKMGMWIETQTLRCIIEGGGDVAFINTLHINEYLGMYKIIKNKKKIITL